LPGSEQEDVLVHFLLLSWNSITGDIGEEQKLTGYWLTIPEVGRPSGGAACDECLPDVSKQGREYCTGGSGEREREKQKGPSSPVIRNPLLLIMAMVYSRGQNLQGLIS
jgi:hypothetical protein